MSTVREGQLSKAALLKLLRAVQQKAPASFPTVLLGLLEELEDNKQEPGRGQIGGKKEQIVFVSGCHHFSKNKNVKLLKKACSS